MNNITNQRTGFREVNSIALKNTTLNCPDSDLQISGHILIIFDASVEDSYILNRGVFPGIEAVFIERNKDGIQQISRILKTNPHLSTLHIISHGFPGGLTLGNRQLNLEP